MNLKSNKYFFEIQDYLMILLGTLLYGFGFNGFILSNEIITGGLSGICALIYFASGQLIPVSISYFVINIILLAVALKILGLKFLLKTIFGVFSLSASLSLFEMLLTEPIIKNEPFMSIIIGGCLERSSTNTKTYRLDELCCSATSSSSVLRMSCSTM